MAGPAAASAGAGPTDRASSQDGASGAAPLRIVVTADDLGLSPGVTRGVIEAHRRGVVRSASLLVTFPSSAEGAELARAERDLEIGVHLDLVGGRPVSDAVRVPTLVDREGRFHPLGGFVRRLATGRIRPSEIATEIRAQVARARALGTPALAWDSHRHTHLIPLVARVVGAVAREQAARWIRRATPPRPTRSWKPAALGLGSLGSRPFLRHTPGNDWYVDLSSRSPRPDAAWVALLAVHGGVGEIGAHPGYVDDELRERDALVEMRPADLALLTDPLLRDALGDDTVRWRVE